MSDQGYRNGEEIRCQTRTARTIRAFIREEGDELRAELAGVFVALCLRAIAVGEYDGLETPAVRIVVDHDA